MPGTKLLDVDVRILRRNLNKGFISQDALDKMLAELPDVEGAGEWFDPLLLDQEEGDDTGDAEASDAETSDVE